MRLWSDLLAIRRERDLAAHTTIDVRIGLACVVVVRTRAAIDALADGHRALMSVPLIQCGCCTEWARIVRTSLRLGIKETVDSESIQAKRNRIFCAHCLLQSEWCCVIVIIIRATAMPAKVIEFADDIRVFTPVVVRVEYWNAVRGQGNGSTP